MGVKDWWVEVPVELWYSLRVAFLAAAAVFVFRLQKRMFWSRRENQGSARFREVSERTNARIAESVTYLQVLLWGLCVVDDLFRSAQIR